MFLKNIKEQIYALAGLHQACLVVSNLAWRGEYKNQDFDASLKNIAIKTPNISAAVVCPDQETVLSAVKEAKDNNLINPTLIGDKNLIAETAIKLSFDIKDYNIIETNDMQESAAVACQMASENKIKICYLEL
mgnify:CR=1 FL=1